MSNITKTALLRALLILVVTESGAAYLYFNLNNPEVTPFIVAMAVLGLLASIWIFTFVRAPKATRDKQLPIISLFGVVAVFMGLCCNLILLIINVLQGKFEWLLIAQALLNVYLFVHFWTQRKTALKSQFRRVQIAHRAFSLTRRALPSKTTFPVRCNNEINLGQTRGLGRFRGVSVVGSGGLRHLRVARSQAAACAVCCRNDRRWFAARGSHVFRGARVRR